MATTDTYKISGSGASAKATIVKDPDARLDYTLDLTDWLPPGDVLVDVALSSTGVEDDGWAILDAKIVFWVMGGTVGEPAQTTIHFRTQDGREDDRTIFFNIKER